MRSKRGYFFMILGALLLIGAVALSFYNYYDEKRAGEEASDVYDILYERIKDNVEKDNNSPNENSFVISNDMKTITIDGREYIGAISIPKMNVNLPVQSALTDDQLRYSPCRYSGNVFEGNLIIAAHNYRTHFGRLGTLENGDKITFTDVDGHNYNYKVIDIYNLGTSSVEEMKTEGSWDLTLFTCTYGSRYRITVRCIRTES